MWYTYIIYSYIIDHYYIGYSEDIDKRLAHHLSGTSRFTSRANDWKIVYSEQFATKTEAIKREREIKRMKSRKYIESLIATGGRPD